MVTPTLTAGIRGTGVYTEVPAGRDGRTYFCNCYGTVELGAGRERVTSVSRYHQSRRWRRNARPGRSWGAAAPATAAATWTRSPAGSIRSRASRAPMEVSLHEVLADIRKNNRVCPLPTRWLEFYRLLETMAGGSPPACPLKAPASASPPTAPATSGRAAGS